MGCLGTLAAGLVAAGCAGADPAPRSPPAPEPIPVGPGPRYRPAALSRAVARGAAIGGLRCRLSPARGPFLAHLEIFAWRRVVAIPAGIGVAPPRRREGAYVHGGRCAYPVRTREPTGLLELDATPPVRLGDLFAIWGQPLSASRVAGFTAPSGQRVSAFIAGRLWRGDPRAIPLTAHAVVVLEVGGFVAPHRSYRFPPLP